MKIEVALNKYPEEDPLPYVFVEIRYKNDDTFNKAKAASLSKDLKKFISERIAAYQGKRSE